MTAFLFESDDKTELTYPSRYLLGGLGISTIVCKGIPKLAKIGNPDFYESIRAQLLKELTFYQSPKFD